MTRIGEIAEGILIFICGYYIFITIMNALTRTNSFVNAYTRRFHNTSFDNHSWILKGPKGQEDCTAYAINDGCPRFSVCLSLILILKATCQHKITFTEKSLC